MTAKVPQTKGKNISQMAIDDIKGNSASHGTRAPIANDWMSPRPKIAPITNGVGKTQQMVTNISDPMKSRNDEANPITIAATVMAIKSQTRLNWKRGSGNQRRVDRIELSSDSDMIHQTADEFSSNDAAESYHSVSWRPNYGTTRSLCVCLT
jgi:hypothetical protein